MSSVSRRVPAVTGRVLVMVLVLTLSSLLTVVEAEAAPYPDPGEVLWSSLVARSYGLSRDEVLGMLERGKTRDEIRAALERVYPLGKFRLDARDYRRVAGKWNATPDEAIKAHDLGTRYGVGPDAVLYLLQQKRSWQLAEESLRKIRDARTAIKSLGTEGDLSIPEGVRSLPPSTRATGAAKGSPIPTPPVVPMKVGAYAKSTSTASSTIPSVLAERRAKVAGAISTAYRVPQDWLADLLGKGLMPEDVLAILFLLDSTDTALSTRPPIIDLPGDVLCRDAKEISEGLGLLGPWAKRNLPPEARSVLEALGFLPAGDAAPTGDQTPSPQPASAEVGAESTPPPSITDPSCVYNSGKVSPFRDYFEGTSETIDPATGSLILRQRDLFLPGRNGLDLAIERVYMSQSSHVGDPEITVTASLWVSGGSTTVRWSEWYMSGSYGYEYRYTVTESWGSQEVDEDGTVWGHIYGTCDVYWHAGDQCDIVDSDVVIDEDGPVSPPESCFHFHYHASASINASTTYLDHRYGLGLGWSLGLPSLEVREDSKFLHLGNGTVYKVKMGSTPSNLDKYDLADMVFNTDQGSYSNGQVSSKYVLSFKDGRKVYFGQDGRLLGIRDRFGNEIRVRHTVRSGRALISDITDSVGRVVTFDYSNPSQVTMSFSGKTWVYSLGDAGMDGKKRLVAVTDPAGRARSFDYSLASADFTIAIDNPPLSATGTNYYLNLVSVTHPTSGRTVFTYGQGTKNVTKDDPAESDSSTMKYYRVTERKDEPTAGAAPVNRSTFTYIPYSAATQDYGTKRTEVKDPQDSSPTPCEETWMYSRKHLLKSRKVTGSGETSETVYEYNENKTPSREITTTTKGAVSSTRQVNYAWDNFRNLLSKSDSLGRRTDYQYDTRHHLVTSKRERLGPAPGSNVDRFRQTANTLDSTGRVVASTSRAITPQVPAGQGSSTFETFFRLQAPGDSWTWYSTRPIYGVDLRIAWATKFLNPVSCVIDFRKAGDNEWTVAALLEYGRLPGVEPPPRPPVDLGQPCDASGELPRSGVETVSITMPEPGWYEIRGRLEGAGYGSCIDTISITEHYPEHYYLPVGTVAQTDFFYEDPSHPGNLTRMVVHQEDGENEFTTYTYDPQYQAYPAVISTQVAAADGSLSTIETFATYDAFGRVATYGTRQGGSSTQTSFAYDAVGRLLSATYAAVDGVSSTKTWQYNDAARTVTLTDEEGRRTIEQYDGLGRFIEARRPALPLQSGEKVVAKVGYNSLGGVAFEGDAVGRRTSYFYDAFKRKIRTQYPDGSSSTNSYDPVSGDAGGAISVATYTDTRGYFTKTYSDAGGRRVKVEELISGIPGGSSYLVATTRYSYDLLDRMTSLLDPKGQETRYSYESEGALGYWDAPLEVDPPGTIERTHVYRYDASGRVTYDDGTRFDYDQLGRVKRIDYPSGSHARYFYDRDGRLLQAELYGPGGVLVSKTGATYDARGRKGTEWWEVPGTRYTLSYSYNKAGDLVRMTYPDGSYIDLAYDGWGRLAAIPGLFGQSASSPGFTYDDSGFLTRISRQNGIITEITPDSRARPHLIRDVPVSNPSNPVLTLDYAYDTEGNVVRIGDLDFRYDGLDRLTELEVAYPAGVTALRYAYDLVGNRLEEYRAGALDKTYQYAPGNHLVQGGGVQYSYGPFGELTRKVSDATTEYIYDDARRLVSVTRDGAGVASYVYDALGRRISATSGGVTRVSLYLGNDIVYEVDGTAVTKYVVAGGKYLAKVVTQAQAGAAGTLGSAAVVTLPVEPPDGSTSTSTSTKTPPGYIPPPDDPIIEPPIIYPPPPDEPPPGEEPPPQEPPPSEPQPPSRYGVFYFHTDLVGSIRAVTDSQGQVVARYDYEPFGLTVKVEGPLAGQDVHKFTGKPEDGATGLYYFNARYYDPEVGRFISQDPARDGPNWYVYCYDNPLKLLDPNGREARIATLSAIWGLALIEPSPVGELIALGLTTYVLTAQGITAESRSTPCSLPVPVARSIPAEMPPRDPRYVIGVHFTNLEGVRQIDAAGFIRPGSYFTLADYAVGNAALDAYNLGLEYGTGKGEYFVMFRVPVESISLHESGLYALPDRTRHNLGGGLQLKNLEPVTRQDWVGGMLYLNTPFNVIKTYAMARTGRYGLQLE